MTEVFGADLLLGNCDFGLFNYLCLIECTDESV